MNTNEADMLNGFSLNGIKLHKSAVSSLNLNLECSLYRKEPGLSGALGEGIPIGTLTARLTRNSSDRHSPKLSIGGLHSV